MSKDQQNLVMGQNNHSIATEHAFVITQGKI